MTSHILTAQARTVLGKTVDGLRRQRLIPAVVYGHNLPSRSVSLVSNEFDAVFKKAGSTSLVDVTIDGATPVKALIHAIQRHPTTERVLHVDLYQVQMAEKLEADIDLHFIGESVAVKEQGGILVRSMDKVKVSCLPVDLVPSIEVDISALKNFTDRIHVRDLTLPPGLTMLEKSEVVVASVASPRSEAEIASLSTKVEENIEGVEVSKKVKSEDAEEGQVAEGTTGADAKAEGKPATSGKTKDS